MVEFAQPPCIETGIGTCISMNIKIRVMVVEDQDIVREGLAALLASLPDVELAGEARDGIEAVTKALAIKPDVILMDLALPGMSGVEAARRIKTSLPSTHILVLTSYAEDDKISAALEAGVTGYLLKNSTFEILTQAIHSVVRNEPYLHPEVTRRMMKAYYSHNTAEPIVEPLTPREKEILILVAKGMTNQEIADRICISELTVRSHVSNILNKLHLENRTQAALYALREGLVKLDS